MKIVGIVFAIIVALAIACFVYFSVLPTSGVRLANELEDYALEYIESHNLVPDDEEIIAYYDVTLTMNGSEAAILTNKTLRYHKNGRNTAVALNDIVDIRHRQDSFAGDIFEIDSRSGRTMKIEILSNDSGETFKNVLMRAWEGSRP